MNLKQFDELWIGDYVLMESSLYMNIKTYDKIRYNRARKVIGKRYRKVKNTSRLIRVRHDNGNYYAPQIQLDLGGRGTIWQGIYNFRRINDILPHIIERYQRSNHMAYKDLAKKYMDPWWVEMRGDPPKTFITPRKTREESKQSRELTKWLTYMKKVSENKASLSISVG
jgi:hypothetical protein